MVQVHYQACEPPAKFPLYFQVLRFHIHSKQLQEENNVPVCLLVMYYFFFPNTILDVCPVLELQDLVLHVFYI